MTDQDPTQTYRPPTTPPADQTPAVPAAAEPPAAPPPAPGATPPPASTVPPAAAAPVTYAAPEAGQVPVATSPVAQPSSGSRPGRSGLKWLAAAVVVMLVVAVAAGSTMLLTGSSGDPSVMAWTPADSVVYGEARIDLPGNQGTELAKVMSGFPGFDDQAAFSVKLGELMDQLVGRASDGTMSYTGDIEPWFNGQLAASVGALPSTADDASGMRAVLLAGVKDADKAAAWAADLVTQSGATTTTEEHAGATITLVEPDGLAGAVSDVKAGYTVVGPVLAIGDEVSLMQVIDTQGKTGLPTNEQFATANASVSGDRLGFLYFDLAAVMNQLGALAGDSLDTAIPPGLLDQVPDWMAAALRAEDSAFVVDGRSPHSDAARPSAEVQLPGQLPATTVVLVEGQDFGAALADLKDQLAGVDELKDAVAQLDDALGLVGGFDAVSGWMGETGIALATVDGSLTGGVVSVPTDPAAADRLFGQLSAFLQLGGSQAGLAVSQEDYAGTTITVIDLAGLGGLAGGMTDGAVDLPADLKISYAVTDNVVVIGYGTDFVKAVLDAPTAGSLADDARFADALKRVGAVNSGLDWFDARAIRELVEGLPFLPDDALGQYETDMKPYLEAFDYVIASTVPGTPYDSGTMVLHVSGD